MRILLKISLLSYLTCVFISCDNNDDAQNNPVTPTDGFTHNSIFHKTENAYISIDQLDRDNSGSVDYYTFWFTDGRITDNFGDIGIGYAHAFSHTTSRIVKLQVFESDNSSITTNSIAAGNTYVASSILTSSINNIGISNSGFTSNSFICEDIQTNTPSLGNENGLNFHQVSENSGNWNYPGTVGPTITINTININSTTPEDSTIDIDYTFMNTNGDLITGHYEGTVGIILD